VSIDTDPNPPLVSVVMSVFNAGSEVSAAIESIVRQSHKPWEFIIVDDGSTDLTRGVIQRYVTNYPQIKLLINDSNCGLAYSLNKAIRHASGKYIARMDADDIAFSDRLEAQVNYLEMHSEISVLGTGAEVISSGRKSVIFKPEEHSRVLKGIEKFNPFFHSSVMMRRDFFDRMKGYDAKLLRAQDYDLWLRGVDKFQYHNLQKVLMIYTSRNQSFQSIYYGLRVRFVNAYRRHRIVSGLSKAVLVFLYAIWVKIVSFFK